MILKLWAGTIDTFPGKRKIIIHDNAIGLLKPSKSSEINYFRKIKKLPWLSQKKGSSILKNGQVIW